MNTKTPTSNNPNKQPINHFGIFSNICSFLTFGIYHREIKKQLNNSLRETDELIKKSQESSRKVNELLKKSAQTQEQADQVLKNTAPGFKL